MNSITPPPHHKSSNFMSKFFLKSLALIFLLTTLTYAETPSIETKSQTKGIQVNEDLIIYPRLFLGVGVGGKFQTIDGSYLPSPYSSIVSWHNETRFQADLLKLSIGSEFIFNHHHGINITASISDIFNQFDVLFNYVYESAIVENIDWAVLTGVALGAVYPRNQYIGYYQDWNYLVADYSISARLKIKHHAIFLEARIPFMKKIGKNAKGKVETYSPSVFLNYAYFFEF